MLALAWPQHLHYSRMERWVLAQTAQQKLSIATCPITQLGFVRVSMNVKGYAADFDSAAEMLNLLVDRKDFDHIFWPDDRAINSLDKGKLSFLRPSQLTDVYLASLAEGRRAKFLTLDERIKHQSVEIVPL